MKDLIDRQAILKHIEKIRQDALMMNDIRESNIIMMGMNLCEEAVRNQPSVQPERKGRWIKLDMHAHLADHKCTACGQECYVPTCMGEPMYIYCPNCGADMRGEQE